MDTGKNREKGVASVEFALILPLLLLVLFLIIEFSIALYDKAVITNASREGARSGIVNDLSGSRPTAADIVAVVTTYCESNLISFGASVPSTAVSGACSSPGGFLTVNVTYAYNFLVLPNFMGSLAGGLTLTGNTVMRCE
jgi:Flp pilus assembly protein TadG